MYLYQPIKPNSKQSFIVEIFVGIESFFRGCYLSYIFVVKTMKTLLKLNENSYY